MSAGRVDPTTIMAQALDGLALRQRVTANNVANAETPGFKAAEVRFEDALQRALGTGSGAGAPLRLATTNPVHLAAPAASTGEVAVVTAPDTTLRNDGNSVDVEQQMSLLADTTLRYSAVSEALARQFAIQRLLVSGTQG